jgi:hypothetical protein
MKGLSYIRRWWTNGTAVDPAIATYAITCDCGKLMQGQRRAQHQVVRCSGCNRELFVLPLSPLPAVLPPGAESAPASPARFRFWLIPAIAGAVALLVVIIVFVVVLRHALPSRPSTAARPNFRQVEEQIVAGRLAFREGNFQLAAEQLGSALDTVVGHPEYFTPADRRQWVQLHRQAAILADWPREPLDRILSTTIALNEDDWRVVAARYRGKAAVFDVELRRDAARQYHVNMTRPLAVARLRLELHNLKLLDSLPLEAPQRVLFAARLADVRREERNAFVVRFEPDSGVLLTDVSAGAVGGIPEAELQTILEQQRRWAAELP